MKQQEEQPSRPEENQVRVDLEGILPLVRRPGRYVGGEQNVPPMDWNRAGVRFCLIFPDLYELGMSHQGLQILYHILNRDPRFLAQRCFAPDVDMEQELRRNGLPLFAMESRRPLDHFDVLGFTLPYELCYSNILTILDLAGLPLRSCERDGEHPLVIGGGSCAMNPEPVADFFDLIVLGDGEEVIVEIGETVRRGKEEGWDRQRLLQEAARLQGVYVPRFFAPFYRDGHFAGIRPLVEGYTRVRRRVLPELTRATALDRPLVPVVKPVHDRLGIEIARGCTRGCRFCQAGMIYRPVRERDPAEILELAREGIARTGFDELALLSLSTGDYSCLGDLIGHLMNRFAEEYVSVSMPSMRVGTLTPGIIEQIRRVRKTGFTVAPEAGTERMREVINKGIAEQDLLDTCRDAARAGWNLIKFYFMVGLPTETDEDVDAIASLARQAREAAATGRLQITVSAATFVPKPHTPFQWQEQITPGEARRRFARIRKALPRRGFRLKVHDPDTSLLEGVFSRGDRRLADVIERAWRAGARLDGWSEHFALQRWQQAAESCGLDLESWLAPRRPEDPLPWDHLHCGVDRSFLVEEWQRALQRDYTPDCRNRGCQRCGLCDLKTIRPRVGSARSLEPPARPASTRTPDQEPVVYRYRFRYQRLGDSRFFSHLEMLQLIFRVLRRAGLPVLFSRGYNPSPRVSFSQALSVGVESLAEFFTVDLSAPVRDRDKVLAAMNRFLPPGVRVTGCEAAPGRESEDLLCCYRIDLAQAPGAVPADTLERFLASGSWPIERVRKGRVRELDVRPLVQRADISGKVLHLDLVQPHGRASISPLEFLEKICNLPRRQALLARICKTECRVLPGRC